MLELIVLIIRAVQLVFAIIVLGLTAYITTELDLSRNNFLLFASVWTLLIVVTLGVVPRFVQSSIVKIGAVALDALTAIFWFAGFIALAVLYNNDDYTDGFYVFRVCDLVDNGCSVIEAAVVFGAFEWALFTATTVLSALEVFRGHNKTSTGGPSVVPHNTA